jgi:hypothetical protein
MARRRRRYLVLLSLITGIVWWRERKLGENDAMYGAAHR